MPCALSVSLKRTGGGKLVIASGIEIGASYRGSGVDDVNVSSIRVM
jgi:hypothetical protein